MKLTESRITANHLVVESKPLSLHLDSEFSFRPLSLLYSFSYLSLDIFLSSLPSSRLVHHPSCAWFMGTASLTIKGWVI